MLWKNIMFGYILSSPGCWFAQDRLSDSVKTHSKGFKQF